MVCVAGVFPLFPARPLIPYKFLECLRPRKPAHGRGRHRPPEQGLGALPSLPSSWPAAHTGQVPGSKQWLLAVVSSTGPPASSFAPETGDPWVPSSFACGREVSSAEGGGNAQTPKPPIPAPKARPALGPQAVGRTSAHNPHHVPKATRPLPHRSQLQLSPTPPGVNPCPGSWTRRFTEPFPKSRGRSEPRQNQREGSR